MDPESTLVRKLSSRRGSKNKEDESSLKNEKLQERWSPNNSEMSGEDDIDIETGAAVCTNEEKIYEYFSGCKRWCKNEER